MWPWSNKGDILFLLGRRDEALSAWHRAQGLYPGGLLPFKRPVLLFQGEESYNEAILEIFRAIERTPDEAGAHVLLPEGHLVFRVS
jgi:tetratricopeptide (TPR) repeat protein